MKQTYAQRILNILFTEESKTGKSVFNHKVANRKFRTVKDVDGTIMRRVRELASKKMVKRIRPGEYTLTAKGRRAVK
jgi:uncharacterized protein YdbL (DUF1318 family)